jgi:hypothetical protein
MDGGSFTATNSTLTFVGGDYVVGFDLGLDAETETGGIASPVTSNLNNCTVSSIRAGNAGNACRVSSGSSLTVNGGVLNVATNTPATFAGTMIIETASNVTLTGGAILNLNNSWLQNNGSTVTLVQGTINATGQSNAFRTLDAALAKINFTGAAGSAAISQANNTVTAESLAAKAATGFFYLDGIRIDPATTYDGTNLAALNAELQALSQGGRYLQLAENAGTMTLSLAADFRITHIAFDGGTGDLLITFVPGGTGYTLTSSNDLVTPFTPVPGAALEGGNTIFRVPAAALNPGKDFFRVEKVTP